MSKNKKNTASKRTQSLINLALLIGIVIFINILGNARFGNRTFYGALDLTEEKRFTLTKATRNQLKELDDVVFVRVLLEGKFPAGFKRLQTGVRELLDDFRAESRYIEYTFDDPMQGNTDEINARIKQLKEEGVQPVDLKVRDSDQETRQLIFPYAQLFYKGRSVRISLLENDLGLDQEKIINNSLELLEYKFINAIQKLQTAVKPVIALTTGHGELAPVETADLERSLRQYYEIGRLHLDSLSYISQDLAVLIVAKPRAPFSEKDKFKIDQYVMNGGKVIWLLDKINVSLDSLRRAPKYYPTEYELNLDDLLFKYGIRIQPNLVLDMQCSKIPQVVGMIENKPQYEFYRYPYHLVVTSESMHPIARNLEVTNFLFASTIDTVRTDTKLQKNILLRSSENSFLQYLPLEMNFEFLRYPLDPQRFSKPPQPLAVLLEGTFGSRYTNRLPQDFLDSLRRYDRSFREESAPNSMLIVSDGDIAKNKVDPASGSYLPLGFNEFERYTFANKEFIINSIEYMLGDRGFIEARNKEVRLRLLNTVRARAEESKWQLLNLVAPLIFLALFGIGYNWLRRQRYARF
jgi:ABC-2 type transport system permease protein